MAHDHKFSWCYGYLYIDADTISYEVDHPSQYKKHEFKIKRSELQSFGRWRVFGQSLDTLELKFGKSTYHLWWLQDENEVHTGPERRTEPLVPAAPDVIIAAIKDPASAYRAPSPLRPDDRIVSATATGKCGLYFTLGSAASAGAEPVSGQCAIVANHGGAASSSRGRAYWNRYK